MHNVEIVQADITTLDCDAIVNAANHTLLGGGGVDGAIHRAAGRELLEECRRLNGCRTGEAKITKGYKLPAKYVIHTVGPIYSGKRADGKLLELCYINSLNLAKDNEILSIAFPAISCGAYGYPIEEATTIAIKSIMAWLAHNLDYKIKIIFCCFSKSDYDVYDRILTSIITGACNKKTLEVIHEPLTNDMLQKLDMSNIQAFMIAESGAMGECGRLEIFYLDRKRIIDLAGNYIYGDIDLNKAFNILPKFVKTRNNPDKDWNLIYMGMGNYYMGRIFSIPLFTYRLLVIIGGGFLPSSCFGLF